MIYEIGKYHEISKISLKGGNVKKLKNIYHEVGKYEIQIYEIGKISWPCPC